MRVKHHEEQVESILSYLEEISFHYIEKMEERLVNGWIIIPRDFDEVKTKLKEARTQILPVLVITESSPVYTTVIPQSLPSFTPPPPQSTPTPSPTNEATNPLSALPNFTSVFQFNNKVSALEKEVSKLKKYDLLNTQVTALVDEHLDSRLGATIDEFMSYFSASITDRITEQVKIQLPQILPKKVPNFDPLVIKSMVTESLEHAVLAKESLEPQSTYEAAASLIEFELKKILINKMDESQSYLTATEHRECYDGLIKSYDLDKNRGLKKRKTSKDAEPTKGPKTKESKFGLSKGTKSQSKSSGKSVHAEEPEFEVVDSDMPQDQEENMGNNDEEPKRKTKATQYDLPGIGDMVPNIWSNVKVTYGKNTIRGISHWREQHKTFYGSARGLESSHDVYYTKRIMAVTQVKVMRKHGYGYLREIENRLTNLSVDDVSDFFVALRMFTRSVVIQKRVDDLQLGFESYQKKINVTKPETTKPGIRNRDPYTPYQDP
nr:hypothetical protein [Tanacetum cinerariifolium]